jgi:hypothetical protein
MFLSSASPGPQIAKSSQVVTCSGTGSIQRWRKHVEGAAKLIEWRGDEQLKSPHSLHLFRQMRAQIVRAKHTHTHTHTKKEAESPFHKLMGAHR